MQLFSDITRTDSGPRRYIESSAEYLDRSAQPEAANIRRLLEDWFSRYLEHRMELHGRLCSADDTHHHAATFELALHELLVRLGMTLEVHPCAETNRGRPEFWVRTAAGETFLLEAVTASLSSAQNRRADRLIDTVYDQINQLDSPNFCSGQGKKDTKLSYQSTFFVVVRTDIPKIRMLPPAVIEHLDIIDDVVFRFLTRGVITVRRPFAL